MAKIKPLRRIITYVILSMVLLLGGCGGMEVVTLPQLTQGTEPTGQTDSEEPTQEMTTSEETVTEDELEEVSALYYAYHTLDKSSQRVYLQVWHALEQMAGETEVSTLQTDELEAVFQYVMADHPELFYVEGYQYTQYTTDGSISGLTFTGMYSMTAEEMQQQYAQITAAAQSMSAAVQGVTDQYEIVKGLYEALIAATDYDPDADNNQNISSVFLQGRSVCQGYAKAMQYLLQQQGIQALLVTGSAGGDSHAWNLVCVDGDYYYLDATWGDASYSASDGSGTDGAAQDGVTLPPVNYDYFLVTTAELTRTHQPDDALVLPDCTATQDNYYIREGCYLDSYNEDEIKLFFQNMALNNNRYATLKCSDEALFAQVLETLITNQEIFRYLDLQDATVAYTTNQSLLTITFWI